MTEFLILIVSLIVILVVHEASHALVAYYLGDPTAKFQGRLTLNPIAHLDMVGSIVFLATMSIGWGKPVPVNPSNFKHPLRDNALTALAGPFSNFVLSAFISLPISYLGHTMPDLLLRLFETIFILSITLGVFNLFPFPPLDGSKVLGLFMPKRWRRAYMNYLANGMQYFVVVLLIDVFILSNFFDFSVFGYVINYLVSVIAPFVALGNTI